MNADDRYEKTYLKLKAVLKPGTLTSHGVFSHWDKTRAAIFETGWAGYHALHFIQVRETEQVVQQQ